MLEINPDTVCFLIDKAREFHAKEGVVLPDIPDSPTEDWGQQALADHAGDLTLQEFNSTFYNLEPDQQQVVVALMWLGRGEFDVDDWPAALEQAGQEWNDHTAEYLIAHPLLADFLAEGLDLLGYRCS